MKVSINKKLAQLKPKEFKKWFDSRPFLTGLDWEVEYKKIGGRLSEPKKARAKRSKD